MDEKTMILALDRTRPLLPMKPGQVERRTHDYVRNGTTDLFATLDVATGAVIGRFDARDRALEFLDFLKLVLRSYPRQELHLVLDNSSTNETPEVVQWLYRHGRATFTSHPPGQLERRRFTRGHSAIPRHLERNCGPFKWVKTPPEILAQAQPKPFNEPGH